MTTDPTTITPSEPRNIALIDDDKYFLFMLNAKLGWECDRYTDTENFIDKGYDLVITDLSLRATMGIETITAIRQKTATPIIVLTGMPIEKLALSEVEGFKTAGANEVFCKDIAADPDFIPRIFNAWRKFAYPES